MEKPDSVVRGGKVLIAGSRSITSYQIIKKIIQESGFKITTVISGHAAGVDQLGEKWAKENKVPLEIYPADWATHGKVAGFLRNEQMVAIADAAIIVHDGVSRGTQHSYDLCTKKKIPTYYVTVTKKPLFDPHNIDSLIAEAKKTPFVNSSLFLSALEYIKNVQLSQSTHPLQSTDLNNQTQGGSQ